MKKLTIFIVLLFFSLSGCGFLPNQYKRDEYRRTMFDYDTFMRLSDFNTACQYVDPEILQHEDCLKRYENLKVTQYNLLLTKPSKDQNEVTQRVEVEYHFLDSVVVKKIKFEQLWGYQEDSKRWLLQTEPPDF